MATSILGQISEKVFKFLRLERVTTSLPIINTDHEAIHKGEAFKTILDLGTVGTADKTFSLNMGTTKYAHFKNLKLSAIGGTAKASIIRNPTIVSAGTTITADLTGPNNMNDSSTATPTITIKKDPNYSAGQVWDYLVALGSATNQFTSVSETRGFAEEELVMPPGTVAAPKTYIIKVERVGSDSPTNTILTMFWYEEDDG